MTEVTVQNKNLYAELHMISPGYGSSSSLLLDIILPIAADAKPETILDYGCGKSSLVEEVAGKLHCKAHRYDPCIEEYSRITQGRFDLVLNTDVLEHVPETELDSVLADIKSKSDKVIFHIPTVHAAAILPDGSNAHCTVRPSPWWIQKLTGFFEYIETFRSTSNDEQFYVTWPLSEDARSSLKRVYRKRRLANSISKRKHVLAVLKRRLFEGYVSTAELRKDIAGKRIAVVGNAQSLSAGNHGSEIDQHDLVMRLNRCVIPHTRTHGQKISWVVTCQEFPKGFVCSKRIQRVIWTHASKVFSLPKWLSHHTGLVYLLQKSQLSRYHARINWKPSTGFRLLCLLEELGGYDQINIYGFDFFVTPTNTNHIECEEARRNHNYTGEREEVMNWIARDPRVTLK
ncbi:glycosyltransferase family 29 protein [Pseudovibrio sp. Tun.PSC04-5.I4]|uniref:glycosyltransferase family 29 protein n=1 Tax=Pseudovibrio sp. Tun.PSC04-5.I4 TaxID=1798213 RepID=UPI000881CCF2|nr:glycosyltransferase family 29 protein [Pseudovibrio sp. Tun.PSC04-5.I4]SDR47152.1 Glycosyltransferase family 29 (sialyltransferase) [Pseudovibrio sp. Tun.PSC04-5.I4]